MPALLECCIDIWSCTESSASRKFTAAATVPVPEQYLICDLHPDLRPLCGGALFRPAVIRRPRSHQQFHFRQLSTRSAIFNWWLAQHQLPQCSCNGSMIAARMRQAWCRPRQCSKPLQGSLQLSDDSSCIWSPSFTFLQEQMHAREMHVAAVQTCPHLPIIDLADCHVAMQDNARADQLF